MMTCAESAMVRLKGIRQSLERKGLNATGVRFYGVPLAELSREDLETIIAFQVMKQSERLAAYVANAHA